MSKKKRKNNRQRKQRSSQSPPEMLDRRLMDQTMASLYALLEGQEFESMEEANAFLQKILAEGGQLPPPPAETPLQKAQNVVYEALEARGRRRVKLARKALSISPDCADAYVLLAEEDARTSKKANEYYAQGVAAGRRALGPEMFKEDAGYFWGLPETRPFMRALEGYAHTLWFLGQHEASIAHQQEMLRLNPSDNQGIRYFLTHCLLELGRFAELEHLFRKYNDDASAEMVYPRALAAFLKKGPSIRANRRLKDAIVANPFVPAFLFGDRKVPRQLPEFHGMGDENEAIFYVATFGVFWSENEAALAWLDAVWSEMEARGELPDEDATLSDTPFDLDRFLANGNFPKADHGAIRRSLAVGLGRFFYDVYGEYRHGKQPVALIDEYMHVPFFFGYGAVEVIHHKRLRAESKVKVCEHALSIVNIGLDGGIPYGLLALVGYLAGQNVMDYGTLQFAAVALQHGTVGELRSDWLAGVTRDELLALSNWIAVQDDIPADEKLWWAWRLTLNCDDDAHTGKAVAGRWLESDTLSSAAQVELSKAWLENEMAGTPPPIWELYRAMFAGDFEEVHRLLEAYGMEMLPEVEDIIAEVQESLAESGPDTIREITGLVEEWILTPAYLRRLAIPTLVRSGEDLEMVIDTYWDHPSEIYMSAQNAGVADAIGEFGNRLPPKRVRALVERGLNHRRADTRKQFYLLSIELYGDEYLPRGLEDNAASLRKWAAKKLNQGDFS